MKKRLFFGFACFVGFSLLIAWQFAAAELADLQKQEDMTVEKESTELVAAQPESHLFL
ncbi:hypothetical protein JRG66_05965 [Salinimicrobium tongyeongense]|uniref:Uncharacterized protein n=1 Tax=Salinimicrobium tongyeongense TaxID=2809707 RepID=A0ABY6NU23_9FLAO|nr:hypothetical protein [Salinimicrobium tongyeongense]UZH56406.1 hypothetical protein JRG66_05965 [Salinimicrobium tongyeongense]